jgi:transposase
VDHYPSNLPITEQTCRRGEVLAGPERRRRWSLDEKARIVAESLAPDAVASVVARRHGIHPNQLYGWRRELRSGRAAAGSLPDFVPIAVTAASAAMAAPSLMVGAPSGQIEIVIGRATVRVPSAADEVTLHRVLQAVRSVL